MKKINHEDCLEIELYFDDLSLTAQEELLEMVGAECKEDMNWDIVPINVMIYEN